MKSITIALFTTILFSQSSFGHIVPNNDDTTGKNINRVIFAYGGLLDKAFLRYIISLTKKINPKICFVPTASGDNPEYINSWNSLCKSMPFRPYLLKTFSVSSNQQTFEHQLLGMDAIIIGAGNAINMLAVWKAQGIDTVLRKAYEKGIILAGGSAGSLCWFANGITGSRSQQLTKMEGLGFLNFSHCPHYYSQSARKPKFQESILKSEILPGYACDDLSGIIFVNGVFSKSLSQNKKNNNYYVSVEAGIIKEEKLESELIK